MTRSLFTTSPTSATAPTPTTSILMSFSFNSLPELVSLSTAGGVATGSDPPPDPSSLVRQMQNTPSFYGEHRTSVISYVIRRSIQQYHMQQNCQLVNSSKFCLYCFCAYISSVLLASTLSKAKAYLRLCSSWTQIMTFASRGFSVSK